MVKRLMESIITVLCLLTAGVLFMAFSSVCYVPQGCVGTADIWSTIMSAVFLLTLTLVYLFLGRRHVIGAYAALTIVFVLFCATGVMVYLNLSAADTVLGYLYYMILAPFAPLVESLCNTFSVTGRVIGVQLFVAAGSYMLSMLAYLIAHNGANRKAVERNYEQMRSRSAS